MYEPQVNVPLDGPIAPHQTHVFSPLQRPQLGHLHPESPQSPILLLAAAAAANKVREPVLLFAGTIAEVEAAERFDNLAWEELLRAAV